jgi:hypothetical protein
LEYTDYSLGLQWLKCPKVVVEFIGGGITKDGGVLLLLEKDRHLGLLVSIDLMFQDGRIATWWPTCSLACCNSELILCQLYFGDTAIAQPRGQKRQGCALTTPEDNPEYSDIPAGTARRPAAE